MDMGRMKTLLGMFPFTPGLRLDQAMRFGAEDRTRCPEDQSLARFGFIDRPKQQITSVRSDRRGCQSMDLGDTAGLIFFFNEPMKASCVWSKAGSSVCGALRHCGSRCDPTVLWFRT